MIEIKFWTDKRGIIDRPLPVFERYSRYIKYKRMKEPKIGKWKLNNYVKLIGIVGGLALAGYGWHLIDEVSNAYWLLCGAGLAITGLSAYWAATDKSTGNDDPKKGSA